MNLSKLCLSVLIFLSLASPAAAIPSSTNKQDIVLNNRILTTVNGRAISVLDVMKQMDVFLSQYYPQYLESSIARLQFYSAQWRPTLERMIDYELMIADAQSREVKATDAEIREEIQNKYGPNIREALDKLGISYEEAKAMVHRDLVVQKIQWLRVTSKVVAKVTTAMTKKAYEEYLRENPPKEIWTYQFLTLRCSAIEKALSHAQRIKELQEISGNSLSIAMDLIKKQLLKFEESERDSVSLSAEFQSEATELSSAHREVLTSIALNTWSGPIIQQSRDGSQVVRIFHLKNHIKQQSPTFETMANELKQELLNKYAEAEMTVYLARLYQKFSYDRSPLDIPPQFEPFSL